MRMTNVNPGTSAYVVPFATVSTMRFTGVPSPAAGQISARLESRRSSRVRTERLRAWSPNCFCRACASDEYCQSSGYIRTAKMSKVFWKIWMLPLALKNGSERTQSENEYYIVGASVPNAASAPTMIETSRSAARCPPREESNERLTVGSPTVKSTGAPLALSKVNSSIVDASMLAKTVVFARPFRICTPSSRRGSKLASTRPVNVFETPRAISMAIQICKERENGQTIRRVTHEYLSGEPGRSYDLQRRGK